MKGNSKKILLTLSIILSLLILTLSCSKEENPVEIQNQPPSKPTIDTYSGTPSHGSGNVSITPMLYWNCSDPESEDLKFDVYFGRSATPPLVSSDQSQKSYSPGTLQYSAQYHWKIKAKDNLGESSTSSTWNFTTKAQPIETINPPNRPDGPNNGETNQNLSFSTGGSISSQNHSIEYRFKWGDGNYSNWSTSTSASHSWSNAGTHNVRAHARCVIHNDIVSDWSIVKVVTITEPSETISTPDVPNGPASGVVDQELSYSSGGASSNLGHSLHYMFDWGDNSSSEWIYPPSASHSWSASGTYQIKARASCAGNTDKISGWSDPKIVTITIPNNPVLGLSSNSLNFGNTNTSMTFNITNNGTGTLAWNISDNKNWITTNPVSGNITTESDQITVTVNRSGLDPGIYNGEVIISSNGGTGIISINMTVPDNSPICSVSPLSLNFGDIEIGQSKDLNFTITNTGGGTLSGSVGESCTHYSIVSGSGYYSLNHGESRTVTVRFFAPTDNPGQYNCTIETGNSICSDVNCFATAVRTVFLVIDFSGTNPVFISNYWSSLYLIYDDCGHEIASKSWSECAGNNLILKGGCQEPDEMTHFWLSECSSCSDEGFSIDGSSTGIYVEVMADFASPSLGLLYALTDANDICGPYKLPFSTSTFGCQTKHVWMPSQCVDNGRTRVIIRHEDQAASTDKEVAIKYIEYEFQGWTVSNNFSFTGQIEIINRNKEDK